MLTRAHMGIYISPLPLPTIAQLMARYRIAYGTACRWHRLIAAARREFCHA